MVNYKITIQLLLALFFLVSADRAVTKEIYNSAARCGDGIYDDFSEECDGTEGCTSDCFCNSTTTADGNGNCLMQCVFGESCKDGCILANVCDNCDESLGFTDDCRTCKENYIWAGYAHCIEFNYSNLLSCYDFLAEFSPSAVTDLPKPKVEGSEQPDQSEQSDSLGQSQNADLSEESSETAETENTETTGSTNQQEQEEQNQQSEQTTNTENLENNGNTEEQGQTVKREQKQQSNYKNVFAITFSEMIDEEGSVTITSDFIQSHTLLVIARCARYLDPARPYTHGLWFRLNFREGDKIAIEIDKRWDKTSERYLSTTGKVTGSQFGLSIQKTCPYNNTKDFFVLCETTNGGTSMSINSPRMYLTANEDITWFMLVHSKDGNKIEGEFTMYFTQITHPCAYFTERIGWNEMFQSTYSVNLSNDHSVESTSACTVLPQNGFWFNFVGSNQILDISTCDSPETDTSIELVRYRRSSFYDDQNSIMKDDVSKVDCGQFDKVECVLKKIDGCRENSHLAKMVIELSSEYDYMVFISLGEDTQAVAKVDFSLTCPQKCGATGACSPLTGECECMSGTVFNNGFCTTCGNGVLDEGEECDLSVEGYNDIKCTDKCVCRYGTKPMTINGVTKCAPLSCGNNIIEDGEECDGGYGCDHCFCVNGTKKYGQARVGCIPASCGNDVIEDGEECDGGDGCVECECQEGWYAKHSINCVSFPPNATRSIISGSTVGLYVVVFVCCFIIFRIIDRYYKKKLKKQSAADKMSLFENTIIPFDKTNSQMIDISKENKYFKVGPSAIQFKVKKPEVDVATETTVSILNTHSESLRFTFHSRQTPKYDIYSEPFTGVIPPGKKVNLTISLIPKCTTTLNEKIPVTIQYTEIQNIIREIKKSNPEIIQEVDISQNSDSASEVNSLSSDGSSQSSSLSKSNSSSQNPTASGLLLSKSSISSSHSSLGTSNLLSSQSSLTSKKKKRSTRITKFHVYLPLQTETALSTKLDYEEIHLEHPPIGGGTFGIVYRANWRKVDVACKVMKSDLVDMRELMPNFIQEAEMMERIRCPYIVNFIGSVITDDTLCLVTEFCALGSLRKFMKTNSMTEFLKVRFCEDIAKGMDYLHENDILHRDLKTDNVLVYSKNPNDPVTCKVTDFGTSRSFIESSRKIALQNIGTPVYMAPEINRKDQMTLKSDVYSFAICMLEVWLGKDPYDPFKFPDSESILKFVGAGKRLDIPKDCPMKDLIEQAWNHNPSDRPSFKEIAIEVVRIVKDTVVKQPNKSQEKKTIKQRSQTALRVGSKDVTPRMRAATHLAETTPKQKKRQNLQRKRQAKAAKNKQKIKSSSSSSSSHTSDVEDNLPEMFSKIVLSQTALDSLDSKVSSSSSSTTSSTSSSPSIFTTDSNDSHDRLISIESAKSHESSISERSQGSTISSVSHQSNQSNKSSCGQPLSIVMKRKSMNSLHESDDLLGNAMGDVDVIDR